MRFMLLLKYDEAAQAETPPDPAMFEEMAKFNTAMVDAGVLLAGEGLLPSARGALVAFDGEEGIAKILRHTYDLVICDIVMPRKDGTSVIIEAKAARPHLPILAISGGAGGVTAKQALLVAASKADRTLEKPFSREDLLSAIRRTLELSKPAA